MREPDARPPLSPGWAMVSLAVCGFGVLMARARAGVGRPWYRRDFELVGALHWALPWCCQGCRPRLAGWRRALLPRVVARRACCAGGGLVLHYPRAVPAAARPVVFTLRRTTTVLRGLAAPTAAARCICPFKARAVRCVPAPVPCWAAPSSLLAPAWRAPRARPLVALLAPAAASRRGARRGPRCAAPLPRPAAPRPPHHPAGPLGARCGYAASSVTSDRSGRHSSPCVQAATKSCTNFSWLSSWA